MKTEIMITLFLLPFCVYISSEAIGITLLHRQDIHTKNRDDILPAGYSSGKMFTFPVKKTKPLPLIFSFRNALILP